MVERYEQRDGNVAEKDYWYETRRVFGLVWYSFFSGMMFFEQGKNIIPEKRIPDLCTVHFTLFLLLSKATRGIS